MTEWSQCNHVARAHLVTNSASSVVTFGSNHSKLHAWKFETQAVPLSPTQSASQTLSLHYLPSVPIRLIDAVFTSHSPHNGSKDIQLKKVRVGDYSVGRNWVEISRITGVRGDTNNHILDGAGFKCSVEVTYLVPKSSGVEWSKCGCPSAESDQPASLSPSKPPQPLLTLSEDFRQMFLSRESTDFTFIVDGEEIPAHKIVLSTRLTYFKRLFGSGMREALENRVSIDDMDATSFEQVLNFVYCGQLPKDMDTSPELFLPVAEKYDMRELKDASVLTMAKNLNIENLVETLIMAHLFRCPDLKSEGFRRLREWKSSVPDDVLNRLKDHPELMVEYIKIT